MVGHEPYRIVARGTRSRHACLICHNRWLPPPAGAIASSPGAWAYPRRSLEHRVRPVPPGIEITEINLNREYVLLAAGLNLQRAEVSRAHFCRRLWRQASLLADRGFLGSPLMVGGCGWKVVLLGVFAHGAIGGKERYQPRHALPHSLDPCGRNAALVSRIKFRDHLAFEQVVERSASTASQAGSSPCSLPSPNAQPTSGV